MRALRLMKVWKSAQKILCDEIKIIFHTFHLLIWFKSKHTLSLTDLTKT